MKRKVFIRILTGIILILFFGPMSVVGEQMVSHIDATAGPGIFFPETRFGIEQEVHETITTADKEIAELCAIPESERNETNTLLELENILTKADQHLQKYEVLAGLYPDPDLQDAASIAAERRAIFIQNLSSRDDLNYYIQNIQPDTPYGEWLKKEERLFFRFGGAGLTPDERNELTSLYIKLETLQNQYLKNIRDKKPLTENLQIIEKSVTLRHEVASLYGYKNWIDFQSEKEGWMMNGEDISTFLGKISPLVKQLVQPVTEDLLSQKRKIDPTTQIIYDYEVESFLNSEINPETAEMMRLSQVPGEIIISRSLMIISCLMSLKTEHVPGESAYAPGVELFRVSDQDSNTTLGWFYLDLKERPGKTKEWFTAIIGSSGEERHQNGSMMATPVFLLSGMFADNPQDNKTRNEDITLFFHELGHLYTRILTSTTSPSSVPNPFPVELTEASSHLFEYLVWTPEFISILSNPEGIPTLHTKQGDSYSLSRPHDPYSFENRWNLARQTIISLLDNQLAQSSGNSRFGECYSAIYSEITDAHVTDQGGYLLQHPHLSGTMAGMYWIYPIGTLYATALFSKFQKSGVMNQTVWIEYIDMVLIPENSEQRSDERIQNFLQGEADSSISDMYFRNSEKNTIFWSYVPWCIIRNIP